MGTEASIHPAAARAPAGSEVERFVEAVLHGERERALELARAALAGGVQCLYEELVSPAMLSIGELWQEGRISVADEHLATEVVHTVIGCLYPAFPWPQRRGARALVTCVRGERHCLGARMVADLLAIDGWDVVYLGADLPDDALVDAVRKRRPALVCLSVGLGAHLESLRGALGAVRAEAPGVRVLVGGRAFAASSASAESLGADALATSATDGVDIARQWKT